MKTNARRLERFCLIILYISSLLCVFAIVNEDKGKLALGVTFFAVATLGYLLSDLGED